MKPQTSEGRVRLFRPAREPGFRLSAFDLVFLVGVSALGVPLYYVHAEHHLYLVPAYVAGTFFLFCNILRIGNGLEAVWYCTFVPLAAVLVLKRPEMFWSVVLGVCEPLKLALLVWRIRAGGYRGVFWRKLRKMPLGH